MKTKRRYSALTTFLLLMISLSCGQALLASDYDPDTGIIDVTCLQGVVNGQSLNKIRAVQLMLDGDTLRVLTLSKTDTTGPCEATLDLQTLTYEDVIPFDGDEVEITATLASGLNLDVKAWVTRQNLITEDVTLAELATEEVALPAEISLETLDISLQNGEAAPSFVSVVDGKLEIQPDAGDAGSYALRLKWDDFVEFLEITVAENTDTGVDFSAKPESLPTFESLNLFSTDSPFNTPVAADPDIDPASDVMVESLVAAMEAVVQVNQYSTPVFFADGATPKSTVELACGPVWELGIGSMVNIPVPEWAEASSDVDGGEGVTGCGEDSGQDNFMVILDLENRCEYDFWQARQEGSEWVASFGVGISMDGSGVNAHGLSARGSGFAFLGGVIWPDEISSGQINHPLAFSYEFTKAGGPVAPATDSDGISEEAFAIPEGAIIQLDPALDLDSLNLEPYEMAIARAMQDYGMILVDSGSEGPVGFYAIDPDSVTGDMWGELWGNEDYVTLDNLDFTSLPFRVLELGEQNANFQAEHELNTGSCSAYQ